MHHRRARPTLRVLQEDLTSDWMSPQPRRALAEGRLHDLHPLSELPHPIIAKATDSFGADPADDNFVGPIASSNELNLWEIKQSQWRGGVWVDQETQVCWLVVSGLAKGGHQDRSDFYKRVEREAQAGESNRWLPTKNDIRLLKQETAARLRTEWEIEIQREVMYALEGIHEGGEWRVDIRHPVQGEGRLALVDITVTPIREAGYKADEIVVEILPEYSSAGSELLWTLATRLLITIDPPEQLWERFGDTYSNIGEPGAWHDRIVELRPLVEDGCLATSQPGTTSHFAHKEHLAGKTINGEAVRSLCGTYFVPQQDHDALPRCLACEERIAEL